MKVQKNKHARQGTSIKPAEFSGQVDKVSTVPAMIWPRILVFTSMMLRVLTPAAFGSYGAGIYIPKLGLVPKHVRPVRPVANLYDLLAS